MKSLENFSIPFSLIAAADKSRLMIWNVFFIFKLQFFDLAGTVEETWAVNFKDLESDHCIFYLQPME